ncbi:MAG: ferredoxin [Pseudomonadota bacterium]
MGAGGHLPQTWDGLAELAAPHGLWPIGGFHTDAEDDVPRGTETLVLLAPRDAVFWPVFTASPEYGDGAPHPLDRWSRRVIGRLACGLGAKALFPFSGPPWRPFIAWALRTGSIHSSPVGLLVEAEAGLFVSLRGALALKERIALPVSRASPCESCAAQPCRTACPVSALTVDGYATETCRSYLETSAGADCVERGCAVRRACPASQTWPRPPVQSAFHMRAFHGSS